jgi:Ser/Thr protein kinase RdoA (MazF antagonist)
VLRPLRSLPEPAELGRAVAAAYGLEVTGCVLLRTLVNDVYRIDTPAGPYVLKLYGPRPPSDVSWEVRLAEHVAAAGVAIARGVPLADGRFAGQAPLPEGPRPFTLWQWAPGARPPKPFDDGLYRRFGQAIARFHAAADSAIAAPDTCGLAVPGSRRYELKLMLGPLLQDVLARVEAADRELIARLAEATRRRLADLGPQLDRGVCHGDVTMDSVHLDGDRFVLYDLDRACINWRAWDLTAVAATAHWAAFLAGYRSVRPLTDLDVMALPWMDVLLRIDYLHFHLVGKPVIRGVDSLREGWVEQNLTALRTAATRLLA